MGLGGYLRAAQEQVKAKAAEMADENPQLAVKVAGLKDQVAGAAARAKDHADAAVGDFAGTAAGQRTTGVVRRVQHEVSQLPGVTAISDATRSRSGVAALARQLGERPDDAWAYLWLAEALQRMKKGQSVTSGVRAVVNPSSVLTRAAMVAAGRLTAGDMDLEESCLRRAYVLFCEQLRRAPDPDALHGLARVYLAMGQPDQACTALRPALFVPGGELGHILVTWARIHLSIKDVEVAREAAAAAVAAGCTLGNEVLADVVSSEARGTAGDRAAAARRAARLSASVLDSDRASYYGTYVRFMSALTETSRAQKEKAEVTARRVRGAAPPAIPPQQSAADQEPQRG